MAYRMDYFRGTESQVLPLLGSKIKYPAFAIIRDSEASDTCRLAFVNQNNDLEYIRGVNESDGNYEKQVVNVDKLPDVSEGKLDVLYIVGENVYLFNGTEYKCINNIDLSEIEALTERVVALEAEIANKVNASEIDAKIENAIADYETNYEEVADKVTNLEVANQELTTKVAELEEVIAALENDAPTFVELE